MLANMAVPTTLQWVAQTRQRLLDRVRPYVPQQVADEETAAARLRQVTADRNDLDRLAARVAHLRARVAWADGVQQARGPLLSPPEPVRTRVEAAVARAPHGLADRDDPDPGDQVRSVVDPEARRGKHGGSVDGSLLAIRLDADSELLGAVQVLPGNGDEARDAATRCKPKSRPKAMTLRRCRWTAWAGRERGCVHSGSPRAWGGGVRPAPH